MSKTTTKTASPAESPAEAEAKEPTRDVMVHLKVTVNGAIIGQAHHSLNKVLKLPKAKADAVVALGQGEIIGVV